MAPQKLSQQEALSIAQSMFNNRPRNDPAKKLPAKKLKDPFAGKVIKSEVYGRLDCWIEEKAFGFIKTPQDDRVFCHDSGFLKDCQVRDFVKFDVWKNTSTGEQKAINVMPYKGDFIEVAKDQVGTIEQLHRLIRGDDGSAFQCNAADFQHGSLRRFDRVRFDSVWKRYGQLTAVNVRPEWSQEEWDQWYAQWSAEDKAPAVDDDCKSTEAETEPEARSEPVNPEMRKLVKKLREIAALEGRQDLDPSQQAKVELKCIFQKRLERLTA